MPTPARNSPPAEAYFAARGWTPFAFQRECWAAQAAGLSGLVHAATGTGKTLAVWMGALEGSSPIGQMANGPSEGKGLKVLWITPMRALAGDTLKSLRDAAQGAGVDWDIQARTGDTSSSAKARLRTALPDALITTPESLSVMLSYPETQERLASLRLIVCDEWHELLGTKRGVQTELCLARLRRLAPGVRTWGLSATLGNVEHALDVLVGGGTGVPPGPLQEGESRGGRAGQTRLTHQGRALLVRGDQSKTYEVETLLPDTIDRFPWSGHIGLRLLKPVIERIESARSTLLFCNTRGQAEIWYQALITQRPDWLDAEGAIAIHHGSLDRGLRGEVEERIKAGSLRCVVCTSSLDLGVDYPPVDQVIQIGSAKGVGRFMQRAGRSGHQPGRPSRLLCVPTNAWELVEFAAARRAIAGGRIEARSGLRLSLDVLCQHLLTLGVGGGFRADEALAEARTTHAFADLTDEQFGWALDFAVRGGGALKAYTRFARLREENGLFVATGPPVVRLHRLTIGTITSDAAMNVRFSGGRSLGTIEEGFVSKLRPGSRFVFAGRALELVKVHQMTAFVRPAKGRARGPIVSYPDGRMPLSHELAREVRRVLAMDPAQREAIPEMARAGPVLRIQQEWSALPRPGELLIERCRTREGWHTFVYPLEGRLVHEGLATLLAFRLARDQPRTFSISASDLGLELLCTTALDLDEVAWRAALSADRLAEDLLECLNASELAKRQFREVARIAGLLTPALPGQGRSSKQTQASSELFFDVFSEFDPGNLLLHQAKREVLERQLQLDRLRITLENLRACAIRLVDLPALSPMAFPLWADRLRAELTTEQWEDRVKAMLAKLEHRADAPIRVPPHRARRRPRA